MDGTALGRQWLSCVAAVVVLVSLVSFLLPGMAALAGPGGEAHESPVRVALSPARGALGGGALVAGEPVYRPVAVRNEGATRFRYHLTVLASGPLASLVEVEVRAVGADCGPLAFASGEAVAGPAPMAEIVRQGGRLLDPGAVDTLCARVELPHGWDVGSSMPSDGAVTDAVLRVSAVQR